MSRENIEKVLMENITDIKNKEIWIFGAGNTASLYYNGLLPKVILTMIVINGINLLTERKSFHYAACSIKETKFVY